MQDFRYKFVRLDCSSGFFKKRLPAESEYKSIIHQHATDGWRLVQIFAPPIAGYGTARYYEIVFERPVRSPASEEPAT